MSTILHDGIREIDEKCFYDCHSLLSFTVPPLVTSLPKCCFYECKSLSMKDVIRFALTAFYIALHIWDYSFLDLSRPSPTVQLQRIHHHYSSLFQILWLLFFE
jgi:hypothetical protein